MTSNSKGNLPSPPKWPLKLLKYVLKADYLEEIEGDMEERFQENCNLYSPRKATKLYNWDTLKLLRPSLVRQLSWPPLQNPYSMFKHNLILSLRNFKRHKTSFLINVLGLSSGLACVLLIFLWVNDELSIDQHYENDAQLYQVLQNRHEEQIVTSDHTPAVLAKALREEIPEIEYATCIIPPSWFDNTGIISQADKHFNAKGQYVDSDYFNVFPTEFLHGNTVRQLKDKSSIVISESMAIRLFDDSSTAIGQTVVWSQGGRKYLFQIEGIFKDLPLNATDRFEVVMNIDLFLEGRSWLTNWRNSDPSTFITLTPGTDAAALNDKIRDFVQQKDPKAKADLLLQRYSERYLNGIYQNGVPVGGRIEYVRLYTTVAIFILLIACINFITLSTAQATRRMKEVGVKKAIGASRKALIYQYLSESFFLTVISFGIAWLFVLFVLPWFNFIMNKQLTLLHDRNILLVAVSFMVLTGLIAGSYPAVYLSGFQPINALRKQARSVSTSFVELFVRKGLVIFQFAISALLIISVVVVYHQMDFIQSKNLGYNRDNIVYFTTPIENEEESYEEFQQRIGAYQGEIANFAGVLSTTTVSHNLTGDSGEFWGLDWKDGKDDEVIHFKNLEVDYDFVETFGIQLAQGRTFSRDFGAEELNIMINQKAVETMGFEDPIGKTVRFWGEDRTIVGVVENFHFESFYEQVKPCIMQIATSETLAIKVKAGSERPTIAQITESFQQRYPSYPFDYRFVDQDYQELYDAEQRVATLSQWFAAIAIIISCLGLFGLASFTTERRTKEIGIRKVLGANMTTIILLLTKDFNRLLLAAVAIAFPVSFIIASNWLDQFAYRIALNGWWYVIAGICILLISWSVIGWQTVKVALTNPVECLRDE